MSQYSQHFNIVMIRLDIQTRFTSKQLSGFFPPRSQLTTLILYKMIQNPYNVIPSFLQKFERPKLPKVIYMYDASSWFLAETRLAKNSKTFRWMWCVSRFQLICLQNYRLNFFHQCLSRQVYLCIRLLDKHIPKYVACIRTLIAEIGKNATCGGFSQNFQKVTQKNTSSLILCFGALIDQ